MNRTTSSAYVEGNSFASKNRCAADHGFSVTKLQKNEAKTRICSAHRLHYKAALVEERRLGYQHQTRSRIPSLDKVVSAQNRQHLPRCQFWSKKKTRYPTENNLEFCRS